jgi:hypothetical protein
MGHKIHKLIVEMSKDRLICKTKHRMTKRTKSKNFKLFSKFFTNLK